MSWQNDNWVIAFYLPEVTLYFHRVGVFILVSPSKFLVTLYEVFIIHKSPIREKKTTKWDCSAAMEEL